jgi:hypothetical protein
MFDFNSLKKQVAGIGAKVRESSMELENLRRKREEIVAAPSSKQDAIAAMHSRIDREAETHRKILITSIRPLIIKGSASRIDAPILAAARHDTAPTALSLESGLCMAFGAELKRSISDTIEAMDWPEYALDESEKTAEITRLDAAIQKTESELTELVTAAHAAGISL